MHELSITCSIVDLVAETAKGRKVHRVTVVIGKLSGVVSNSIAFWFPEVARGTELAEASLEIREVRRSRAEAHAEPNSPLPP
jgi:hydrogenase nickel incorporation protein HypA/HybF